MKTEKIAKVNDFPRFGLRAPPSLYLKRLPKLYLVVLCHRAGRLLRQARQSLLLDKNLKLKQIKVEILIVDF